MEAKEEKVLAVTRTASVGDRISVTEGSCSVHYEFGVKFYNKDLGDCDKVIMDAASHTDEIKNGKFTFDTFAAITDGELFKIITDSFNIVSCEADSKLTKIHIGGSYSQVVMIVRKIED